MSDRAWRVVAVTTVLAALLSSGGPLALRGAPPRPSLLVFGAASTAEALQSLADRYGKAHGVEVKVSLASSSVLARQVEQGAPADLFISADTQWMDYLEKRGLLAPGTRRDLLGNRLVLVARKDRPFALEIKKGADLPAAFRGRLAVGDPEHVPAGIYAKQSLLYYGWWDSLKDRLAPAENVRAALRLVELGEADAGIVYASDARASEGVVVAGTFEDPSHDPIVYPAAVVKGASPGASALLDYLGSREAWPVWEAAGFIRPPERPRG